jgi:hypothetical protein
MIWKQDPSVGALGLRLTFVPTRVVAGPRDWRIRTELPGTTPVQSGVAGDFVFPPGTPESDCAHAFAVTRSTLSLFERALHGQSIPWAWNVGSNLDPVSVFPRAGVTPNAFYSRSQRALKFFFFTPSGATTPVFTCRSLDIVAHETGHAVLDGLKPGWIGAGNPPQTGGLHESFGDLAAIFLALSQLDQVDALVALTKAHLHEKNFIAALAEQFGAGLGRPLGLRNADNDLKLSQVGNEVHAISQVFTGAIYDILADLYAHRRIVQFALADPAQILLDVAHDLCDLVLNAMVAAPNQGATYTDVANAMLNLSVNRKDPAIYRTIIRHHFTVREVVVAPVPLAEVSAKRARFDYAEPAFSDGREGEKLVATKHPSLDADVGQDRSRCCGTMQLPEFNLAAEPLDSLTRELWSDDDLAKLLLAGEIKQFRGQVQTERRPK